jgi:hypothetical protein
MRLLNMRLHIILSIRRNHLITKGTRRRRLPRMNLIMPRQMFSTLKGFVAGDAVVVFVLAGETFWWGNVLVVETAATTLGYVVVGEDAPVAGEESGFLFYAGVGFADAAGGDGGFLAGAPGCEERWVVAGAGEGGAGSQCHV